MNPNLPDYLLIGLSSILILGIVAQWLAWRLRLPAILLLLAFGLLAGPFSQLLIGTKIVDPDLLFGKLIYPIVSISVALVLFEGSLTLNIAELRQVGRPVLKLVTIGAAVTCIVSTLAACLILHMHWRLALLLGSILSVTGPTVIGPLLRQIQPTGRVGPTLRWEGIVIDPLGAVLALLVFEIVSLPSNFPHVALMTMMFLAKTMLVGGSIGFAAAALLVLLLRRFWLADHLHVPVSLMFVVASFVGANLLQDESGLLAVTVMGITLANQRFAPYRHILEFKESLSILLISSLFIVVGSRLQADQLSALGFRTAAFVAVLIFVARPLSVFLSTARSELTGRERIFISGMAPRGVVAAAVSSIFALRLRQADMEGADRLVPVTFSVIIATVTTYGLFSPLLARRLGLAKRGNAGFLIAGAHPFARMVASALAQEGQAVALADTNRANIAQARLDGLNTYPMSILSDQLAETVDGTGLGRLLALTPNEEVNSLAAVHFARIFGRSNVYQLEPDKRPDKPVAKASVSHELHGRVLSAKGMTYETFQDLCEAGATIKKSSITPEFTYAQFLQRHPGAIPLFVVAAGELSVVSAEVALDAKPGQAIISLVPASETTNGAGRAAVEAVK